MISAKRYHDISCGHRVYGHESKCAHLHGHNYRVTFTCASKSSLNPEGLDEIGRVIDFGVIKSHLCMPMEEMWDHKFLVWQEDPWAVELEAIDETIVILPFNPTAEKMAEYLRRIFAPVQLAEFPDIICVSVLVEETAKCAATSILGPGG